MSVHVTGPPLPPAPLFVIAEVINSTAVMLIWDDNPVSELQYLVSFMGLASPNPVTPAFFQTQNVTIMFQTRFIVNGLQPGSTYSFSVSVDDPVAGQGPPISAINTTLEGSEFLY